MREVVSLNKKSIQFARPRSTIDAKNLIVSLAISMSAISLMWSTPVKAASQDKPAIKIGTTNALTGPVASACKAVSDGAQAWFHQVNKHGGIHGRKIENKVLDDAYTAPQALANARQFVSEDVIGVFGGCGSIQPPAILPIVQRSNIPYLFPYATSPTLSDSSYSRLFLALPNFSDQLASLIKWTFDKHGPGRVYLSNIQIPGASETETAVKNAVEKYGGTYVGGQTTTAGTNDYTPLVLNIKTAKPDYVVLAQSAPAAARIVNTMKKQGALPKKWILGMSPLATRAFVDPVGKVANGKVLAASPIVTRTSKKATSCLQAFRQASQPVKPGGFSLFGCGTAQLLTTALKETGQDPSRDNLVKVLKNWKDKKASPIFPRLSYSQHKVMGNHSIVITEVQRGRLIVKGKEKIH